MYKKIITAIILNVIVISLSLGIIGYLAVNESIKRSLQNRLALAHIIANNISIVLQSNLNRLYDISLSGRIDLNDSDWEPEKKALHVAYQYSMFTDGVFLLDKSGNAILTYPPKLENPGNLLSISYVNSVIQLGTPIISDVYTLEALNKQVIFALVPLKANDGTVIGVAGGEIDPTNYMLTHIIKAFPEEPNTFMEIVDSYGIILASNNPKRVFASSDHNGFLGALIKEKKSVVQRCHRCHTDEETARIGDDDRSIDMLAFAPLEIAPWGISIIQPEKDVFEPARRLRNTVLLFSIGSIGIALIVAVGMSRSIVKPLHRLIHATHKIASGELKESIAFGGVDEIGRLSSSFEIMRVKLADSLEGLQRYNIELEERVNKRTKEIQRSHKKIGNLLKKIMSVQEEERKRIARGLHDETMQSLSAILMKLELCRIYPDHPPAQYAEDMVRIMKDTLEDIRNVIQNLRPSILDDLGLEEAIKWLLDKHLQQKGITCYYNTLGSKGKRFHPYVELMLFRIIQEAIVNISRHANANNVFVIYQIEEDFVKVDIEDDGEGFDMQSALKRTEDGRGLGILGMTERAHLVDGELNIYASPGNGTRVTVKIPLTAFDYTL